ncbi:C6 finger domain-containing protein [Rutstroemia sp. NJR-2017a WRK4]|nr:C6 finger domain-containing protein [Rutstroemia sp. NJR-2017a WRK4]
MGARSKGCRTCKTRRLKCDEQEPACRRCQKANLTCPGYESIFVDETARVKQSAQQSEFMIVPSRKQRYHSHKIQSSHASTKYGDPNATLPLVAFKDKIVVAFLATRMFEARSPFRACSSNNHDLLGQMVMCTDRWWVCKLIQSRQESLHALALMYFGRANHLKGVETDASKQYGQALQKLRLLAFNMGDGWKSHADGLAQLMELRGPSRHKGCPERSIFLEQRVVLVSRAILFRRRTFLARPEWKTVPWEDDPQSKLVLDFLLDILCDFSGLLEDLDSELATKEPSYLDLQVKTESLIKDLNAWWRQWLTNSPNAAREVAPARNTIMADEEGLLYPTLLSFDDYWDAYSIIMYNALRILLLQVWQVLSDRSPTIKALSEPGLLDETNSTVLQGISSDMVALAHENMRLLEYFHVHSWVGTASVRYPLDVTYGCLPEGSRAAKWLGASRKFGLPAVHRFRIAEG